ncbi:hypothetical protein EV182_006986 [Spiromyces aspiralis]|uniref:Uncharacterized protein n=1 Tax=Spiromyces aspiralis TaxID=68401 RepID=A0ACC1HB18_9FUNG|nr:hypothetical protein EV182_006986 [Spiromyces aspiralis]
MRVDRSFGYIDNSNRELVFKINAVDNEGVAAAPTSAIPTSPTDSAAEVDHILFVCTKCQRKKLKESCEEVCGQNYLKCRLGNLLNSDEFCDMEDMIVPMTPSYEDDGRRKKTGRILYENLKGLYEQSERLKARAACHGDPQHSHHDLRRGEINCPNAVQPRLKIVPVDCLSYCDYANVVALAAPNKFQYQVAKIREDDPEDIEALLEFAESYLENEEDGFTKSKTRPNRLKGKVVARIPPLKPDFRNRAFD